MGYELEIQTHTIFVVFMNPFETFVVKIQITEYNHKKHKVNSKFHKVININWSYQ